MCAVSMRKPVILIIFVLNNNIGCGWGGTQLYINGLFMCDCLR